MDPPNNPPEPNPPAGAEPNAGAGVLPNDVDPKAVDGAGVDPNVVEGAGVDPNVVEGAEAPKPKEGAGVVELEPKENPPAPPFDDGAGVGAAPKEKAMIMNVIQIFSSVIMLYWNSYFVSLKVDNNLGSIADTSSEMRMKPMVVVAATSEDEDGMCFACCMQSDT